MSTALGEAQTRYRGESDKLGVYGLWRRFSVPEESGLSGARRLNGDLTDPGRTHQGLQIRATESIKPPWTKRTS